MSAVCLSRMAFAGAVRRVQSGLFALAVAVWLTGCAGLPDAARGQRLAMAATTIWAVTDRGELIELDAREPERVVSQRRLVGLALTERVLAVTFRPTDGALVGVSSLGKYYEFDRRTGQAQRLNKGDMLRLAGMRYALHADADGRLLHLVSDHGQDLWLDAATGAAVTRSAEHAQALAVDVLRGEARWQAPPASLKLAVKQQASASKGVVATWGLGPADSADVDWHRGADEALAALQRAGVTQLYAVQLATGKARPLGRLAAGQPLWALAVQP